MSIFNRRARKAEAPPEVPLPRTVAELRSEGVGAIARLWARSEQQRVVLDGVFAVTGRIVGVAWSHHEHEGEKVPGSGVVTVLLDGGTRLAVSDREAPFALVQAWRP